MIGEIYINMNLLFIGDVVGQSGCDFIRNNLYKIKKEYEIDVTIANGEKTQNEIYKNEQIAIFKDGVTL